MNPPYPWTRDNPNDPLCAWHRACVKRQDPDNRYTIILRTNPFMVITSNKNIQRCKFRPQSIVDQGIFHHHSFMVIDGVRIIPRVYGCECQIPIYDDNYDHPREEEMKKIRPIVQSLGVFI